MLKNLNKFVPYQNSDKNKVTNFSRNEEHSSRFTNPDQENKFEKTMRFKFKGSFNPLKKNQASSNKKEKLKFDNINFGIILNKKITRNKEEIKTSQNLCNDQQLYTDRSGEEQRGQSRPDTFRLSISKPSHKTPFKDAIEGAMLKISRKKSLSTKMSPNRSRNKVNRDLGCVYAHSELQRNLLNLNSGHNAYAHKLSSYYNQN